MNAKTQQFDQPASKPVSPWATIAGHFGVPIHECFSWKARGCPGLPRGTAALRELASTIGGVAAFFYVSKSTASDWKQRGCPGFSSDPDAPHDLKEIKPWVEGQRDSEMPNSRLIDAAFRIADLEETILTGHSIVHKTHDSLAELLTDLDAALPDGGPPDLTILTAVRAALDHHVTMLTAILPDEGADRKPASCKPARALAPAGHSTST